MIPGMSAGTLRLGALALSALLLAGCGSGGHRSPAASSAPAGGTSSSSSSSANPSSSGTITLPDPPPTGKPPAAADLRVIRAWADTLRRGDVPGAARYFALPSVMINGPNPDGTVSVVRIHSRADAVLANAGLPCGARLRSADQRGIYINALFVLTGRSGLGGGCQGTSGTGRVNFVIRGGLIVRWIRARDEPGDSGQAGAGGSPTPPASTGTSPVV